MTTEAGAAVEFGVLDGTTPPEEWIEAVEAGHVLVLTVEGDVTELAAGFASDVRAEGARLVHHGDALVVVPDGVTVSTDRL